MRRSGVRPAVCWSKLSRDTPRRAASGHSPSTQAGKLAAAARIASRVISGWPEAPASPAPFRRPVPAPRRDRTGRPVRREQRAKVRELARQPASTDASQNRGRAAESRRAGTNRHLVRLLKSAPDLQSGRSRDYWAATWFPISQHSPLPNPRQLLIRDIMKPIRKAIFPVAGLGTRFLPATKADPQRDAARGRPAGDPAGRGRGPRGRHRALHLRHRPQQGRDRGSLRQAVRAGGDPAEARQEQGARTPRSRASAAPARPASRASRSRSGSGHAVWCAREIVGNEPFALMLPDMLHFGERGCLADMMEVYAASGDGNVIAVYEVPREQVQQYGDRRRRRAARQGLSHHRHGGEAQARRTRRRTT